MLSYAFALAALALGATAQDSSSVSMSFSATSEDAFPTTSAAMTAAGDAQTTITGLIGEFTTGFAASVVSADACDTTLAMQCTDDSYLCQIATGVTLTVTQGPTGYEYAFSTSTLGGMATISQTCDLRGPISSASEMVCTASAMVSAYGTSTADSTVSTLTRSDDFNYAQIPITAGASNLPSGATCTATDNAAAPTGITEIYKVVVPVGAAIMAGAAFI